MASDAWRRAAVGLLPPVELRGRVGGIYHRPRFLEQPPWTRFLKMTGFRKLLDAKWLRCLLFVDEYLTKDLQKQFPDAPISFLPDVCPAWQSLDQSQARRQLNIPLNARVFLFYGGGYRRKGLDLAVRAMNELPPESPAFLLCAGQLNPTGDTAANLHKLVDNRRALLLNRYVSDDEEKMCFAASDGVLLPYLHHFGTSGVLSRAAAAGRMVIVSDEQLLGRLTRQHRLGLLFPSGNAAALRDSLLQAIAMNQDQLAAYSHAAAQYAAIYSREAFRRALTSAIIKPVTTQPS
jgi:glycosyltransferase involved in cell wall biosynthesis